MRNMRITKFQFQDQLASECRKLGCNTALVLHAVDIVTGKATSATDHRLSMRNQFRVADGLFDPRDNFLFPVL